MRWMRTIRAALLMTACLGGAAAAADPPAAAPGVETAKKADALFHEGVRFVTQQSWKEAEEKFLGAWALNPTYDVAANLGQTQYRMGKYRDAAEHLAFALKHWPIIGKKEPREGAQKRFEEVRGHVGAVKIQVSMAGATVFVDGKEIGKSPIEIEVYVEPGKRTIEAKLAGYEDAKQTIEATPGGEHAVTLALAAGASAAKVVPASASAPLPLPSGSAAQPPPVVPGTTGPRPGVLIAGGATAGAALVAGVIFTVLANGKASAAEAKNTEIVKTMGAGTCAQPVGACGEVASILQDWTAFRTGAVWSFVGAGTLGLATGVYALVTRRSPRASMHAAAIVRAGGGGIAINGAW